MSILATAAKLFLCYLLIKKEEIIYFVELYRRKETLEEQLRRPRKCKPFNVLLDPAACKLSDPSDDPDYFLPKPPYVRTRKLLDCRKSSAQCWKIRQKCLKEYCAFLGQEIYYSSSLRFITSIERNNLMVVVFRTACQAHSFFVRNRSTEFLF